MGQATHPLRPGTMPAMETQRTPISPLMPVDDLDQYSIDEVRAIVLAWLQDNPEVDPRGEGESVFEVGQGPADEGAKETRDNDPYFPQ